MPKVECYTINDHKLSLWMLTEKGGKSIEQSDLFHIVMYSVVINMLQHSFYSQIRRSLHSFKLSGGLKSGETAEA